MLAPAARVRTDVELRRSGWKTPEDLEIAAARSKCVGDEEMPDDVRWIRTYALSEEDGTLGTVCIYEGNSAEAVRRHAQRAVCRRTRCCRWPIP